ncbi:MAG: DNA-3-methyladenine glycosylase [Planctomycetota bacterium]
MNQPPNDLQRLSKAFYARPTAEVAADLIGNALLHRSDCGIWVGGWIVETEAYLGNRDPASHSARGKTQSNQSMFLDAGSLYVYPIHSRFCLNAVTESAGIGSAVLIRAIEPVWGIAQMRERRGLDRLGRLAGGPAMLCEALAIDRRDDGRSLLHDEHLGVFRPTGTVQRKIVKTRRIGISKAAHRLLRFVDADSKFLSRPYRPR